jgi:hypothetical protein
MDPATWYPQDTHDNDKPRLRASKWREKTLKMKLKDFTARPPDELPIYQ